MKTVCKPFLMGLVGLLILLPMSKAFCQTAPEPAIVVSIAPIQDQIADANYVLESSGFGSMKFLIKTQMKHFTKGIDPKKASGVLLYFEDGDPTPRAIGFAPISNLDDFLDTISGFADVDDEDEIIQITPSDGTPMLMKQVGDYIFVADNEDALVEVPKDPNGMLGDMPSEFNVAARIFGQRVPEGLRAQLMDTIKDGYLSQMEALADADPELAETQREAFEEQMAKMEESINDMDEVLIGFSADEEAESIVFDFKMTALPGTALADNFSEMQNADPSRFGGFLRDDAAMNSNVCLRVLEPEAEQYANSMSQGIDTMLSELDADGDFSESEIDTIESATKKLTAALTETFESGRIDAGMLLMMAENKMNLAAAMEIIDPRKVEDAVKELVELGESKLGDAMQVNLNSGSHNGVAFHELVFQVPEDEEEMQDYFGPELTVILGIGKKEVYIGAGTDPMDTLKESMDSTSSGEELLPVVYNFYLTPVLRYAASVNDEPMIVDMVAQLEESGKDRIRMFVEGIENGVHSRFELQDGVLGLIQSAFQAAQSFGSDF